MCVVCSCESLFKQAASHSPGVHSSCYCYCVCFNGVKCDDRRERQAHDDFPVAGFWRTLAALYRLRLSSLWLSICSFLALSATARPAAAVAIKLFLLCVLLSSLSAIVRLSLDTFRIPVLLVDKMAAILSRNQKAESGKHRDSQQSRQKEELAKMAMARAQVAGTGGARIPFPIRIYAAAKYRTGP